MGWINNLAVVKGPMFSTWASGSVWKLLTYSPRYDGSCFVVSKYKSCSGFRHEIQIINAEVFKQRQRND